MEKAIIKSNYECLLHDEEDILFCGNSETGETIIGSIMEDDDDMKMYKHMHAVIDPSILLEFKSGRMSYLNVLKNSKKIYFVNTTYKRKQTIRGFVFHNNK